ncbi:DUF2807 domain-containing protein [Myxococcaceae bacterium GXIMD 01537]
MSLKLRATYLLPVLLLSTSALAEEAGSKKEERREVGSFERVAIGSGLSATVRTGETSVSLSGDEKLLQRIETRVKDGELLVRVRDHRSFRSNGIKVTITTPRLEAVEASGGSTVEARPGAQKKFSAEASGGSTLTVGTVDATKVEVEASGGSGVTLKGRAEKVNIEASGGSEVHADDLEMATLEIEASGGSTVEAGPSESVEGDLSGGSEVHLSRSPSKREVETSGGSRVVLPR